MRSYFELIANASSDVADQERSLPIAYIGGVLFVILLYVLIAVVVIGHLDFAEVSRAPDTALSLAGRAISGQAGYVAIAAAALLATTSAINATFYSTGRMAYIVAKTGELPHRFEKTIRGEHAEGTLVCAVLALGITNFVPLDAIATMGSAGFLIIFMLVNLANVRLARETGSRAWISAVAAISTARALVVLCVTVDENPATRRHLWILVGLIVASLAIETCYRLITRRSVQLISQRRKRSERMH